MPNISDATCVLVIGATSGIGRALAIAIHELPSKPTVIVAGRRQERLDELCRQGDRFHQARVDLLSDQKTLEEYAASVIAEYPNLDAVIYSSGIAQLLDFTKPDELDLGLFKDEFTTNYISIITLIKSFMPHFLKLSAAGKPSFIIPLSSALGIYPHPAMLTYCATKAALHSMALGLHGQLRETNVHVMEVIPPLADTEFLDTQLQAFKKIAMPLDEFTRLTMEGLLRGDVQNTVGTALPRWEKFEKGKVEAVEAMMARRP